jgi:ABC-2 type transport system ATP-binding protein
MPSVVGMEATIAVTGLRKRFGSTTALDGMTFTVTPGQVTGFVGPNGAGKSTTMRVTLGLDSADEGTAMISGRPYRSLRHPLNHVGALLDAAALHPARSGRNHLLWQAHSQGMAVRRVDEVLAQTGMESAARRKAGGYSLGMRQRLGIAGALLGDPPVLMLDEPFNGLDPEGIIWMRGFLQGLAAEGRAVLVSSHLMSELQDTAGHHPSHRLPAQPAHQPMGWPGCAGRVGRGGAAHRRRPAAHPRRLTAPHHPPSTPRTHDNHETETT